LDQAHHDPLIEALAMVLNLHQVPVSANALAESIALPNKLTADVFIRLAEANDCAATLRDRALEKIPELVVPVILLLNDDRVAVMTKRLSPSQYVIRLTETGEQDHVVMLDDLKAQYTGQCFFIRPPLAEDVRANTSPTPGRRASDGHWFWSTFWNYRGYYFETAIAAILINVLALAGTFFTMNVYDRVVPNQALVTLWTLAVGVCIALGFEFLARNLRAWLLDNAGKKADLVLGSVLFRQSLQIRLSHRAGSPGAFANNLREFESVRDFATSATLAGLTDLPFMILFIAIIGMIGGPLFWVPLICVPIILSVTILMQWPMSSLIRDNLKESSVKHGLLIEAVEGTETIKAVRAESWLQSQYEISSTLTAQTSMKSRMYSNLVLHFSAIVQSLATVVMIVWGVYIIGEGKLTQGALIGAVMLASRALAPLNQVTALGVRFQQAKSALQNLNRIMSLPVDREQGRNYLEKAVIKGEMAARKLMFSYAKDTPLVIDQIDVNMHAGEKIAILGRIGSGKSTLLKLLSGLYQPTSGQVLVDGIDIEQIEPSSVRRQVQYVPQEARLFHGTLRQNLMIANPNAPESFMLDVCQALGIHQFASLHPRGYDMLINERGEGLSGGQRQSVAFARALIARPKVILLDEPTSAMDGQSEQQALEALARFAPQATAVLVTHKLQLVQFMQRVIVIDAGKRVADGPRDAVMNAIKDGRISKAPTRTQTSTPTPVSSLIAEAVAP
jgi:ATP-binding cassette, subfamily C, bacterial LapB